MSEPYSLEDLRGKVDWEGGVLDAIEYGIKPAEVPEGELRDLWTQACALHEQLDPVLERIGKLLDQS